LTTWLKSYYMICITNCNVVSKQLAMVRSNSKFNQVTMTILNNRQKHATICNTTESMKIFIFKKFSSYKNLTTSSWFLQKLCNTSVLTPRYFHINKRILNTRQSYNPCIHLKSRSKKKQYPPCPRRYSLLITWILVLDFKLQGIEI